jgi:hypothetical protein
MRHYKLPAPPQIERREINLMSAPGLNRTLNVHPDLRYRRAMNRIAITAWYYYPDEVGTG